MAGSTEIKTEQPPPSVNNTSIASNNTSNAASNTSSERTGRKRKSRWGDGTDRINIPGLPTQLPPNISDRQLKQYLRILRIEDISRRLRIGDVLPPTARQRSPSPEPIYGPDGKRENTRENRYRNRLEDERHMLVEEAQREDPNYRPPMDYRRTGKLFDKVYIPNYEFQEINFMGLLIGPRGNTLKKMESDSGAKISIRGKGTAKENRQYVGKQPGEDEDMHAYVQGDTEEKVQRAIDIINDIISLAASTPDGSNALKQQQLRELALLNGTIQEDASGIVCNACGALGHKRWECPKQTSNILSNVGGTCRLCNQPGHIATECPQRNDPQALQAAQMRSQRVDTDYASLMAELGGNRPAGGTATSPGDTSGGVSTAVPWAIMQQSQVQATAASWYAQPQSAEMWQQWQQQQQQGYDQQQATYDPNAVYDSSAVYDPNAAMAVPPPPPQ